MSAKQNPLPLEHTLRDLAVLRASDIDLGRVLPQTQSGDSGDRQLDKSVDEAVEFIRAGRETVRTNDRGSVESEGGRLERARATIEHVAAGLMTE